MSDNILEFKIDKVPKQQDTILDTVKDMQLDDLLFVGKKDGQIFLMSTVDSSTSDVIGYLELLKNSLINRSSRS